MVILPALICKFEAIPFKSLAGFFVEIDKPIQKSVWKFRRTRIIKIILIKKGKVDVILA